MVEWFRGALITYWNYYIFFIPDFWRNGTQNVAILMVMLESVLEVFQWELFGDAL